MPTHTQLAVIGGGPAGLRAAEVAAEAGLRVTLYDGKRSVGRKFLVAGKGGLNLTHGELLDRFVTRYSGPNQTHEFFQKLIGDFPPAALREWADGLGIETFQASSGRIYPTAMKAAPLLRRWIERLRDLGVRFEMNHHLASLERHKSWQLGFSNSSVATADRVILALGGGSWSNTGSDGGWIDLLQSLGVACNPLMPANCGWEHAWPDEIVGLIEGKPLKNISASAGGQTATGELMATRYGLEGGAIYQLGAVLRGMSEPAIAIDFKPTFTHEQLVAKMQSVRRDFLTEAKIRWKLSDAAAAILAYVHHSSEVADQGEQAGGWKPLPRVELLASQTKHCVIPLTRPRPLDEAISSAGGVKWSEIEPSSLMLNKLPGVFVAGEMIDWEAPTGGYLMQGCFATGTRAARAAVAWSGDRRPA